jgi:membrane protease YdiL (CAAX protease family)
MVVDPSRQSAGRAGGPSPTEQLVEVSVFLFLVVPSMTLSFFAVKEGSLGFVLVAVATILRDLSLVGLILFFAWRNGEPVAALGWNAGRGWSEVVLGVLLFVPMAFGAARLESALRAAGFGAPATPLPALTPAHDVSQLMLAAVLVVVVAVAEETIFRGYLMLRLITVTESPAAAVVLSAVLFSLGHGYEGSAGVITVAAMGAVFAVVYLWRGSLAAPVTMHFLQDFIGIVVAPLLVGR